MLFLIISNPHPSKPIDVKKMRLKFRSWINDLKSQNKVISFYPIVGRGSVVIFDVNSNEELHKFMTQWLDIIPVNYNIYPLITSTETEVVL